MTNADRIRAMTDEELGRFLAEVEYRRSAAGGGAVWRGAAHAIEWLRQPVKEDRKMNESKAKKRRYNQRLEFIAHFEKWLSAEPPMWMFWRWKQWINSRPMWGGYDE